MLDAIHQNVVYQIDLGAARSRITGTPRRSQSSSRCGISGEVERRVAEEGRKRKEREGRGGGGQMV